MSINRIASVEIFLMSDEDIRRMSHGEVERPDTLNYRTLRPEPGGLFCERIFGPVRDFECACGKDYRREASGPSAAPRRCPRCGVEITWSRVRRERMGHIELAAPVVHPVYAYGLSPALVHVLGMSLKDLQAVAAHMAYAVMDPGTADLRRGQVIDDRTYRELLYKGYRFRALTGAEAIEELLEGVDLLALERELRQEMETAQGIAAQRAARRLQSVLALLRAGTSLKAFILRVVPVLPPDLRPLIRLDGGRFATPDLNELYRRVITRNLRLRRLLDIHAPDIIVRNEKRLLQEAVDALYLNSRLPKPVMGPGKRPLKSLVDLVSGKHGRLRQNLLGKRVDYSGRSVIVVGPHLKLHQVGLPKEMALELFKPMVIRELVRMGYARSARAARDKIQAQEPEVWDALERVVKGYPVLLNRAPTLHRLSIQAFEPVLVEGRAIQLHPLVCAAYNADFDGDTMAVHVPLSPEAQAEALILMLSTRNLLDPKNGTPIVKPDKDMLIGIYFLTMARRGVPGEYRVFSDAHEAILSWAAGHVHLNAPVWVLASGLGKPLPASAGENTYLLTTPGIILFNRLLPGDFPYVNGRARLDGVRPDDLYLASEIPGASPELPEPLHAQAVRELVRRCIERYGMEKTAQILDGLKDAGFRYATRSGLSLGLDDLVVPPEKAGLLARAMEEVRDIQERRELGEIPEDEARARILEIWDRVNARISDAVLGSMGPTHPLRVMLASGARANPTQVRQLSGWRGIMLDPSGRPIEVPIKSSFREGLTVLEYFTSTHGARKGQADTALKTADSGYLTRRMVDVAQHVVVREEDCGDREGLRAAPLRDPEGRIVVPLEEMLFSRVLARDVEVGGKTYPAGTLLDRETAAELACAGVDVYVRTPLTCRSSRGVCRLCYGGDLGRGGLVDLGEAVGIIAAQSIGEPGTQLTMRTFHTGGVAAADITQGLPRVEELLEARTPRVKAVVAQASGVCSIRQEGAIQVVVVHTPDGRAVEHPIPYGRTLRVQDGQAVQAGDPLSDGGVHPKELMAFKGRRATEEYILAGVQAVYRSQGVQIHNKHLEIIVRQMFRARITDPGDTWLLPGQVVMEEEVHAANAALAAGQRPASWEPVVVGITRAALTTDSFLSAASFQSTARVLAEAAVARKVDHLRGLKENVILGRLVPAGTGLEVVRQDVEGT